MRSTIRRGVWSACLTLLVSLDSSWGGPGVLASSPGSEWSFVFFVKLSERLSVRISTYQSRSMYTNNLVAVSYTHLTLPTIYSV